MTTTDQAEAFTFIKAAVAGLAVIWHDLSRGHETLIAEAHRLRTGGWTPAQIADRLADLPNKVTSRSGVIAKRLSQLATTPEDMATATTIAKWLCEPGSGLWGDHGVFEDVAGNTPQTDLACRITHTILAVRLGAPAATISGGYGLPLEYVASEDKAAVVTDLARALTQRRKSKTDTEDGRRLKLEAVHADLERIRDITAAEMRSERDRTRPATTP